MGASTLPPSAGTPSTPAGASDEMDRLPIEGFKGTPDEIERQWFEQVYKGRGDSMLQLTMRAVLMGSVLGGVLSLTNLYIGLKAGWGFGVAITACILSYAIWTFFYKINLAKTPMTILENNCMQSTASSAGYSTGGTLVSAFAAYILLNERTMPVPLMMGWVFFLAILGVTMAIPMKRQMINIEQLRFPSGIAAAETLRALHSKGSKGMQSARALAWAGLFGLVSKFWTDGLFLIHGSLASLQIGTWVGSFNQKVFGPAWVGRTVMFSWEPMFIAAGAITGLRVCTSMLLGGVLCWMVFAPIMQHAGVIQGQGYRTIVSWSLWAGTSCMVTSGLLAFGMQWKSAARAFSSIGTMFKSAGGPKTKSAMEAIECPPSWFFIGQGLGVEIMGGILGNFFGNCFPDHRYRLFAHHLPESVEQLGPFFPGEFDHVAFAVQHALEQLGFELNTGQDFFFDTLLGDEVDDVDALALLAYPADPAGALVEAGRVPGQFEVDDAVRCLQVETGAAGIG
jgi:hypothetical protein